MAIGGYAVLAFLFGSIPFALLIGRLKGVDLRRLGSGNPGATNAFRNLGALWGIGSLIGDAGKGWIAVALLPRWLGIGTVGEGSLAPLLGAAAAVAGHSFSPWCGFRGGKGVATAMGSFIALCPLAAGVGIAAFLIVLLATGFVSAGSAALTIALPIVSAFAGPPPPLRAGVVALGVVLAAFITWRHRANWARIVAGTEARFRWGRR